MLCFVSTLFYSIVFIDYPNPISLVLKELEKISATTIKPFFANLLRVYNNLILQLGFRLLLFVFSIWVIKLIVSFILTVERKLSKRSIGVSKTAVEAFAYNLMLINLIQNFVLGFLTILLKQPLILVNYYIFLIFLLLICLVKLLTAYRLFWKKSHSFVVLLLGNLSAILYLLVGVVLQ
jgi:hypothetical protein